MVWLVLVCWCNVHSPCCPILLAVVVPATETISSFEDSNDRSVTLSFSICSMLAVRLFFLFLGIDFSMILSDDLSSSVLLLMVDRTAVFQYSTKMSVLFFRNIHVKYERRQQEYTDTTTNRSIEVRKLNNGSLLYDIN